MNGQIGRVTEAQIRREMLRDWGKTARRRAGIGMAVVVALAVLFGILASRLLFVLVDVRTDGMRDVLQGGDVVLCLRTGLPLVGGEIGRGDLVLVRYSENGISRQAVRRVIAVAGEAVAVEPDGHVAVDDLPLDEPYATWRRETDYGGGEAIPGGALDNPFATEDTAADAPAEETPPLEQVDDLTYPITVADDMVFVMCDNREDLLDSRSSRFGLIRRGDVLGVARAIVWPACRAGILPGGGG